MARWVAATVVFLAIGLAAARWGHDVALALLVGALVIVALFGGHKQP